jgi:hypothetical protein
MLYKAFKNNRLCLNILLGGSNSHEGTGMESPLHAFFVKYNREK